MTDIPHVSLANTPAFACGAVFAADPAIAHSDGRNRDNCPDVALEGKNDCRAGAGFFLAGNSKFDCQGKARSLLPTGTSEETASMTSRVGFGQLAAIKEWNVLACYQHLRSFA